MAHAPTAPLPPTPEAGPDPRWLALGLGAAAWWGLLLLVLLAAVPALGWAHAHQVANGDRPGAVKVQAPILATRHLPATEQRGPVHRLWVNTLDRGVLSFSQEKPFPPDWTVGHDATLRRVPGYPSINALDLPGARALSALEVWVLDMPQERFFWTVPGLALAGALGSLVALLLAWRAPTLRLPGWLSALLGGGALSGALLLGVVVQVMVNVAKPNVDLGAAQLLPVLAQRPPEAVKVFVQAPDEWAPLSGKQAVSVGAEEIARVLGPQHRVMVLPNRVRQSLVYEAMMPAWEHEPPLMASYERAALAAPWALALQGVLWLGMPFAAWWRRRQAKPQAA